MGLDMYAYACHKTEKTEDGYCCERQIAYWRKHPNTHGWMEALHRKRNPEDRSDFNCTAVELSLEDIEEFEKAVLSKELPETEGFFFGKSYPEDKETDLEFIEKAKHELSLGHTVYYTSWW